MGKITNKISLKDFIKNNNELLGVFGIFAGVSAYFGRIPEGGAFMDMLYLFFLFLAAVLGIEIIDRLFDNSKGLESIKLTVFEYLFFAGISMIATYSVVELFNRQKSLSFVAVWLLLTAVALFIIEKFGYLKKIKKDSDKIKLIKYIGLILISAFMYFVAKQFFL